MMWGRVHTSEYSPTCLDLHQSTHHSLHYITHRIPSYSIMVDWRFSGVRRTVALTSTFMLFSTSTAIPTPPTRTLFCVSIRPVGGLLHYVQVPIRYEVVYHANAEVLPTEVRPQDVPKVVPFFSHCPLVLVDRRSGIFTSNYLHW